MAKTIHALMAIAREGGAIKTWKSGMEGRVSFALSDACNCCHDLSLQPAA
jgi:hypothetical protein